MLPPARAGPRVGRRSPGVGSLPWQRCRASACDLCPARRACSGQGVRQGADLLPGEAALGAAQGTVCGRVRICCWAWQHSGAAPVGWGRTVGAAVRGSSSASSGATCSHRGSPGRAAAPAWSVHSSALHGRRRRWAAGAWAHGCQPGAPGAAPPQRLEPAGAGAAQRRLAACGRRSGVGRATADGRRAPSAGRSRWVAARARPAAGGGRRGGSGAPRPEPVPAAAPRARRRRASAHAHPDAAVGAARAAHGPAGGWSCTATSPW